MKEIFQIHKELEVSSTHSYWGAAFYMWCM